MVKINFYKTGSVVLQGAKCTKFTEMYFGMLKSRLENENQPHQESEPLKAITVPNIPESEICEARLTDNTPMSPTIEINSVRDSETLILKRLTPQERVSVHSKTLEQKLTGIDNALKLLILP